MANPEQVILGVDPGSRVTGFGVIAITGQKYRYQYAGVIKTTQEDMAQRLRQIYRGLLEVITQFQPQAVAIEKVFAHINVNSALLLAQARGAALAALGECAIPVHEYTARQVKSGVAGYGNATKEQVQHMVKTLLTPDKKLTADASDALAIALCHAQCATGLGQYIQLSSMRRGRGR